LSGGVPFKANPTESGVYRSRRYWRETDGTAQREDPINTIIATFHHLDRCSDGCAAHESLPFGIARDIPIIAPVIFPQPLSKTIKTALTAPMKKYAQGYTGNFIAYQC
jgi:hypothetical protein